MEVPVHIASSGQEWLTELAVLSAAHHSKIPAGFVVGGSVGTESETLGHLPARLEISPGRRHADWLNHWIVECPARFAVFLDSDVFFHHTCWLTPLIQELENGAGLVSCALFPRTEGVIEPVAGEVTTAMPRPAPWVMAVNVQAVKETGESFEYMNRTLESGERLAWDIGGRIVVGLEERGWPVRFLPPSYGRCFTHVGAMSWRPIQPARIETKRWLKIRRARLQLRYERLRVSRVASRR